MYLQNPGRVESFGCLILIAAMLYVTLEYVIRAKMAEEKALLELPGKRKSWRPTALSVLEMFEPLEVMHFHAE
ncbi:hypothetical protein GCM10010885_24690 [Alicyclobacillus cellulosilyticus]|uniref:Uncharacterized protein n=1 Tax=Alicyclobacillus cellulosilyticus TaxID=1003997 RepID=A0A917KHX7_9BACL|nr:hypothetical protein GCM10010885_24690 [Alicyclobacillus cellulosilyticus]